MAKIHAPADFQESNCPACGATINGGPKSRKRKVQCPKCREIVELGKPEPVAKVLPDTASVRPAEFEALLARMEILEARVAALEGGGPPAAIVPFPEQVAPPAELLAPVEAASPAAEAPWPVAALSPGNETPFVQAAPPAEMRPPVEVTSPPLEASPPATMNSTPASHWLLPMDPLPPEEPPPVRQLRWVERSERHRVAQIPADVEEALAYNLTTVAAHEITIRAANENSVEWRRAVQLKAIFARANWQVTGPQPTSVRPGEHDLLLTVGSLPPSAEAAGIYLALTAAGFSLDSVLDPKLKPGQAALVVG